MGNTQYTFKWWGTTSLNEIRQAVDPHGHYWYTWQASNIQMNHWPVRKLARKETTNPVSLSNCYGQTYYHIGWGW